MRGLRRTKDQRRIRISVHRYQNSEGRVSLLFARTGAANYDTRAETAFHVRLRHENFALQLGDGGDLRITFVQP